MTEHDKRKGAPDKGHKTWFSPSEVNHSFPDFRSFFRMEYDQPWSMGKISLELYEIATSNYTRHTSLFFFNAGFDRALAFTKN